MMRIRSRTIAVLWIMLATGTLLAGWATLASPQTDEDPAVRQLRSFYDVLLDTMKQADKLGIKGRYDKLTPVIRATFDLPAMTRIAVGPSWSSIGAEQQSQLLESFTRMTIATYANRFDGFSGQRFEVEPGSEARATGRVVHSKLVPSSGEPVALNYLMRESGGSWKIVDVYLKGTISELATRRTEFTAILKEGGPSALISSLRQQGDKMMQGPAKADANAR
ncbi:MAG TPA: ABC transporter substrate-binding protein [Casimicrobiaceae bacterium]|nr:ABC transporter substrate-binding protein [Casimicrobiaceae bacterium]